VARVLAVQPTRSRDRKTLGGRPRAVRTVESYLKEVHDDQAFYHRLGRPRARARRLFSEGFSSASLP
jgi:hypothetical protein